MLCLSAIPPLVPVRVQPKMADEKETMVFKRAIDRSYSLKMKASRAIFSEINTKFPIMPFTARYDAPSAVQCMPIDWWPGHPI